MFVYVSGNILLLWKWAVITYFLALYSITETVAASKHLAIAMERNSKRAKVKKYKSIKATKPKTKFKFMSEEVLKAHSQDQPGQA